MSNTRIATLGRQYGLRIDQSPGPWLSFGIHVRARPLRLAHVDLHIGWWLITIGRHYGG